MKQLLLHGNAGKGVLGVGGVGWRWWWLKVEIKKRYGNVLIITTGLVFNPFLPRFPVINRRQWKGDWKPSVVHIAVCVAINIFSFGCGMQ